MSHFPLEELFNRFSSLRVLVIGDVMTDAYIKGKVERISPEAPVPVLHISHREYRPGGAANVALNVVSLGASVTICGVVGTDAEGQNLRHLLEQAHIGTEGLLDVPGRVTTVKQRIMSGSHHLLRIDDETTQDLDAQTERLLIDQIARLLPTADVVILEDYNKGVLTEAMIRGIITLANQQGIPVVVDPKKRHFDAYKGVQLFKPNLKELREGLNIDVDPSDKADLVAASTQLRELLQADGVLITLSERGMYLDMAEQHHRLPAYLRNIADVSGAGDTVISVAALCLALKVPPLVLLHLANLAGGLVCEYAGVVPIDRELLRSEALKHHVSQFIDN